MADKERRFSPLVLLGDALLLLCALCGLTASFLSLYTGPVARQWADVSVLARCAADGNLFLTCAVLFALLSLAAWSLPRFRWAAAGGLAALWLLWVWWSWDDMLSGAMFTCKAIADLFAALVDWGKTFSFSPGLGLNPATAHARLFLLAALALLALVLGWAVVRARRWWLVLALTLPPLLPGLLADLYPSWPPFLALATCWCAMILCDLCRWAAPSGRGKLTLIALPAAAAVLAAIMLIFPQEGYTRPPWALEAEIALHSAANRASDFFAQWDGPFRRTVTYVGAAEEADLAHAGPLSRFGRTVLRVESDYDGRMYLRGSSLAVYEDGVWKALPEGTWQEYLDCLDAQDGLSSQPDTPLLFPALQIHDREYTATIDNVGAVGSCVYAPYFLTKQDWAAAGVLPVEDSFLAREQGQWVHTIAFADLRTQPASVIWDAAYRDYVYTHYLDVPEELRRGLSEICWMIGTPYSVGGAVYAAQEVGVYLGTLCEYDPETPAAPEGTDPVLWFLNNSRRGYCMHYASAATLILRSMGVPARYVSGFTLDSVPGQRVDVPDRAAHAWVEVWLDGFGWYPVEVTPAAAFDWYEDGQIGQSAPPEDTPTPTPEQSETPEPTPTPTREPGAEDTPAPSDAPQGGGTSFQIPTKLLKALGWTTGMAALLWLGWYLPWKHREKQIHDPNPSRAGLACYGCLMGLKRWGGQVGDRAVELAEKAKFSRQGLTDEEAGELRLLLDWERVRLRAVLPPAKRLLFGYLWDAPPTPKKRGNPENSPGNGD